MTILKAMTLRLSPRLHRMVVQAAQAEGVSQAQFVRESLLVRLAYMRATKDPEEMRALESTLRELWRELEGP